MQIPEAVPASSWENEVHSPLAQLEMVQKPKKGWMPLNEFSVVLTSTLVSKLSKIMAVGGSRSVAFWLFLGEKSKVKVLFYSKGREAAGKSGNDIQISQLSVLGWLQEF